MSYETHVNWKDFPAISSTAGSNATERETSSNVIIQKENRTEDDLFDDRSTDDEEDGKEDKSKCDDRADNVSSAGSHCEESSNDSANGDNESKSGEGSDDSSDGGGKVGPAPYIRGSATIVGTCNSEDKENGNEDDW